MKDGVRATLGYESISIYGVSYGTRLALTYMRRFPTRVRVAVLDGVVPPDLNVPLTYAASAEASLEKVFAACAADLLCGIRHPHVAEHFHDLLQRLDKGPLDATVRGEEAERINVKMSRGDFGYAVRGLLYTAGIASRLAGMIDDAAGSGRLDAFAQAYVDRQRSLERTIAFGQHLSVFCAEDVPFATDAEIATAAAGTFLGRYLFDEYRAACRGWPRAAIAADARTPVTSRVPTLLVSGAFDPVTPPAFAEHVQRGLPLARWIVSPTAAHGAAAGCPRSLVLADLEHGSIDAIGDECRR
jgi:pimeloyl-ACP methyl ester carboxylesterase